MKVTPEQLRNVAGQLSSGESQISTELSNLHSQVSQLANSDWSGAASSNFQTLYGEWNAAATQVQDALLGIAKLLNAAATVFEETEAQNTKRFSLN